MRIFPPAKEDWNTLYVEFGSEYEVDLVFKHTRVMVKENHKVVRWIPKELYERFLALDTISYNMREEMKEKGVKLRTKVAVGKDDLELSIKMPNGRWRYQPLPKGLPSIDLEARRRLSLTSSPPPGRPDMSYDDRKRQHSGSDADASAKKTKTGSDREGDEMVDMVRHKKGEVVGDRESDKREDMVKDKKGEQVGDREGEQVWNRESEQVGDKGADMSRNMVRDREGGQSRASWAEAVEKDGSGSSEILVAKHLDPGSFTNQEAYSPWTPAKTRNIPDLPVIINSPVFHSKAREYFQS